ncbi:hypothetical protein M3Y98_00164300 [Aphelenchoides besseyi]|nr:hypothetical protein M3Y98_00164300 [Aphelenchoides besseyi]KAI6199942.1 hypothetical protein M3Y96_00680700 [Aphelenchoides besseyi]
MDQNSTPRGGPAPKKAHFANRFLEDPNIEQTLLMDTANAQPTVKSFNFIDPKSSTIFSGGSNAKDTSVFEDSLADLTCAFNPTANERPNSSLVAPTTLAPIATSIFTSTEITVESAVTTSTVPLVQPEAALTMLTSAATSSVASMSLESAVIDPLVEAITQQPIVDLRKDLQIDTEPSMTVTEQTVEAAHETTVYPIPDIDFLPLIEEAIELEVDKPSQEELKELSDSVALIEFLSSEHLVRLMNKEKVKAAGKDELADAVRKFARSLLALGKNHSKKNMEDVLAKDRADFEAMLAVEREKTKNVLHELSIEREKTKTTAQAHSTDQECQTLRYRIVEVEKTCQEIAAQCTELKRQNEKLQTLCNDADDLEAELIKAKAQINRWGSQLAK